MKKPLAFVAGAALAVSLIPLPASAREAQPPVPKRTNTWSVVAADPKTGDVGVAAASCVPGHMSDLAALVPGKGASVTQSAFDPMKRDKTFAALKAGAGAADVVRQVLRGDTMAKDRQYGVVTIGAKGVAVEAFTGKGNTAWAGSKGSRKTFPVTAQGNTLVIPRVVTDAIKAFDDPAAGKLAISDRLMRALEAGSAAGGDKRCNTKKGEQTARSAFILVARGKDAPYVVTDIGEDVSKSTKAKPFLALSSVEPEGGANPLIGLRGQYDQWRAKNLPKCSGCNLSAVVVPHGGVKAATDKPGKSAESESTAGISPGLIAGGAGLAAVVAAALVFWRRRSR